MTAHTKNVSTDAGPTAQDYIAELTPEAEIDPERACLVIVDLQYGTGCRETGLGRVLAAEGRLHEAKYRFSRIEQRVVPNTKRLLDHCRERGIRRVFVTYGSEVSDYSDLPDELRGVCVRTNNRVGEREHEIIDELKPWPNERVLNKLTQSAFNSTPIDLVLRTYGVTTLFFTGASTNNCVEHTMRDAADHGYLCFLVEDACGTDSPELHEAALMSLRRLYGKVVSTDEALEKLGVTAAVGAPA